MSRRPAGSCGTSSRSSAGYCAPVSGAPALGGTAGARRNQLARALDRVAVELRIDEI
jgi:hypothetical protein